MSYRIINPDVRTLEELVKSYDQGGAVRLDLGCGYYKKNGFIGLDNFYGADSQRKTETGPDIEIDLMANPIPFNDGTVDEIFCSHYLEHVDIGQMLGEIYRVLKPTGALQVVLPYAISSQGLYPGHTSFYTEQWFFENKYFSDRFNLYSIGWRKTKVYDSIPIQWKPPFDIAKSIMFNVCDEFTFCCTPRKDGAPPPPDLVKEFVYEAS